MTSSCINGWLVLNPSLWREAMWLYCRAKISAAVLKSRAISLNISIVMIYRDACASEWHSISVIDKRIVCSIVCPDLHPIKHPPVVIPDNGPVTCKICPRRDVRICPRCDVMIFPSINVHGLFCYISPLRINMGRWSCVFRTIATIKELTELFSYGDLWRAAVFE